MKQNPPLKALSPPSSKQSLIDWTPPANPAGWTWNLVAAANTAPASERPQATRGNEARSTPLDRAPSFYSSPAPTIQQFPFLPPRQMTSSARRKRQQLGGKSNTTIRDYYCHSPLGAATYRHIADGCGPQAPAIPLRS